MTFNKLQDLMSCDEIVCGIYSKLCGATTGKIHFILVSGIEYMKAEKIATALKKALLKQKRKHRCGAKAETKTWIKKYVAVVMHGKRKQQARRCGKQEKKKNDMNFCLVKHSNCFFFVLRWNMY